MDTVDPEIAVISSAFDSQYGHPHEEVLERFDEMDIETYWTGVHGDIVVTTDGESTDITTADSFSSDPADLLDAKPTDDADDEGDDEPAGADVDADDDDGTDTADDTDEESTETEAADDADGSDATPIDDPDAAGDVIDVVERNVEGVSPEEEYIVLENTWDRPIEMGNWQIRDREDGGQIERGLAPLTFPAGFELGAGERVTIWTGDGDNTETDLYWGYGVNMWNAEGDVVILMDSDGEQILRHPYGDQS